MVESFAHDELYEGSSPSKPKTFFCFKLAIFENQQIMFCLQNKYNKKKEFKFF